MESTFIDLSEIFADTRIGQKHMSGLGCHKNTRVTAGTARELDRHRERESVLFGKLRS